MNILVQALNCLPFGGHGSLSKHRRTIHIYTVKNNLVILNLMSRSYHVSSNFRHLDTSCVVKFTRMWYNLVQSGTILNSVVKSTTSLVNINIGLEIYFRYYIIFYGADEGWRPGLDIINKFVPVRGRSKMTSLFRGGGGGSAKK